MTVNSINPMRERDIIIRATFYYARCESGFIVWRIVRHLDIEFRYFELLLAGAS